MSKTQTFKTPTDEEIQRIDNILNQLDALVAQLPLDYQMDYAQELMDRHDLE